jgi:hypothetical protein
MLQSDWVATLKDDKMTGLQRRSLLTSSAAALAGLAAMPARAGAMSGALQASSVPVTLEMAPPSLPPIPSPAPAPAPVIATPTVPATPAPPRWQRFAVARPQHPEKPAITIVIDDLGVMHPATERVIAMPGPLTLSWFPFAHNLVGQVAAGAARGHEMTLHMPMQSNGVTTAWTGPDPLRIDLPPAVNLTRLRAAMDAVPATVGLNNHMGSVATRDPALMALVAQEAKARDMLFLDSVVIAHSCAYSAAHDAGVPAAARDIFIDHSSKPEIIRQQLEQIEVQARRHGHVIAIGHPWPHTVAALEEWLPTLQAKGFELWPLSAMVARRNGLTIGA